MDAWPPAGAVVVRSFPPHDRGPRRQCGPPGYDRTSRHGAAGPGHGPRGCRPINRGSRWGSRERRAMDRTTRAPAPPVAVAAVPAHGTPAIAALEPPVGPQGPAGPRAAVHRAGVAPAGIERRAEREARELRAVRAANVVPDAARQTQEALAAAAGSRRGVEPRAPRVRAGEGGTRPDATRPAPTRQAGVPGTHPAVAGAAGRGGPAPHPLVMRAPQEAAAPRADLVARGRRGPEAGVARTTPEARARLREGPVRAGRLRAERVPPEPRHVVPPAGRAGPVRGPVAQQVRLGAGLRAPAPVNPGARSAARRRAAERVGRAGRARGPAAVPAHHVAGPMSAGAALPERLRVVPPAGRAGPVRGPVVPRVRRGAGLPVPGAVSAGAVSAGRVSAGRVSAARHRAVERVGRAGPVRGPAVLPPPEVRRPPAHAGASGPVRGTAEPASARRIPPVGALGVRTSAVAGPVPAIREHRRVSRRTGRRAGRFRSVRSSRRRSPGRSSIVTCGPDCPG
jgi:hypothetical protein